jgi:putative Holliday junction resolvase
MPGTPDAPAVPTPTTVLGFDFGTRRIGVAYGQRVTGTARALAVVANAGTPDWAHVDRLVKEWRPEALVVGLPLTLDGQEQDASKRARAFGAALAKRYALPIHEQDERLSSVEAASRFADARKRGTRRQKHAEMLDAMAAQIIVESFFMRA